MKLLVIGKNGQLGWEIMRQCEKGGMDVHGVDLPEFSITEKIQVHELIEKNAPSLVINASAYTLVDRAEEEESQAFAVNAKGPGYLADVCRKAGAPLIHISTDFVFDGRKTTPYQEDDPVSPLGVYGKTKAEGEKRVRERINRHVIIRTSWLYGVHGRNIVKTVIRLAAEHKRLRFVTDQVGCPTLARDLAEAILIIARKYETNPDIPFGTYHYSGKGETSWHEFAREILSLTKERISVPAKEVDPITGDEMPLPAKRPAFSVLDCAKIRNVFGVSIYDWRYSLNKIITEILKEMNYL